MSGPQEILKSFVLALGWQHDDVAAKKVFDQVSKIEKGLTSLVVGAEAAAIGVVAALGKMAEGFERAYYASSRSGSAVRELNAFKYAASQTGSTAEEAASAVDGLAQKIRENRGFRNLVQGLTGDKSNDIAKQITELGSVFSKMSSEQAHKTGEMLGLSEHLILALQSPDFAKFQNEYRAKASAMGVDLQKAAEDGKNLTQTLRDVRDTLGLIVDSAHSPLFQQLDAPLKRLNDFLIAHGKEIGEILGRIAGAFVTIVQKTLELLPEADKLANAMGGWETVFAGLAAVISVAFVGRIASLFASLKGLATLGMPPWLTALLGVSIATDLAVKNKDKPGMIKRWDDSDGGLPGDLSNSDMDEADRRAGLKGRRGLFTRFKHALQGKGAGRGNAGAGTPVLPPTTPGTYRPQYKLSDADVSDAVVSVVAGEAGAKNPQGVDAVINTMFNRLGTSAYGPSGNLKEVAYAPGQFVGRGNPTAAQARYIRDRIKAIASGGVRDNTNGANEFRTSTYTGPWMRNHPGAVEIGGNSFDRNRSVGGAVYAPYPVPRVNKIPPMLKAPSAAPLTPFNPSVAAPPLGSQSNDNSKSVTVIDQSKTTVNGVSDPQKAADHIGRIGDRQQSLLLRNMQGAVG